MPVTAPVRAAAVAVAAATALSLPRWLPGRIVALRTRVFARINGQEGIAVPGDLIGVERFREVYSHPAAGGRSRGAALSDLFWYWLSPGAELHQEHIEAGERYDAVARATRGFLSVPRVEAEELTRRCVARTLRDAGGLVRLRDLMMPVWAEFYYELVFGEPCPPVARDLIVGNADDVVTALKCCGLRHMDRRDRLTRHLTGLLPKVRDRLPAGLSAREQALYLQGAFFNTAVVQMSEAMAHLLMVLAQHPDAQAGVLAGDERGDGRGDGRGDERHLDRVISETLRLYPLFGVAHRVTTGDIPLDERTTIPAGSVLCFDYPAFHRAGFSDPDRFDPGRFGTDRSHANHSHLDRSALDRPAQDRPEPDRSGRDGPVLDRPAQDRPVPGCPASGRSLPDRPAVRELNHIPFGVAANRPCPAWRLAPITMRVATREILRAYALDSSASHTRSMPNRGPCLLVPRGAPTGAAHRAALRFMRFRDRWEDVWRSLVQLVLGTYMVWDARRQRLCERHFAEADRRAATESR
ncbi:cytochrome P450 [Streptosporangium sp. NPDC023615]|uniref:cytochrome P450 n=1 Tax=Streptosporangium sp. NPDC023615 TaxID=3154794 RepID=UPI0034223338